MGSSSRKKSSKKRSSKLSSKPRRMKKTRRNASKKLGRRRHDTDSEDSMGSQSVSSPSSDSHSLTSDDGSMSSASISSSEHSYRSRKKVSRSKKRARGRAAKGSSIGEDLSRKRKRKRSKKEKGDSKSRKKPQKKKARRDKSISSGSSDSFSCSTCNSSSSREKSGFRTHRISSMENKKDKSQSKAKAFEMKENAHMSADSSTYSRDQSCMVSQGEENIVGESVPRRLKSVITVVAKPHEEEDNQNPKDLIEEKTVDNRNDFPASKTIEISGTSKRDLNSYSRSLGTEKQVLESSEHGKDYVEKKFHHPSFDQAKYDSEDIAAGIPFDASPGGDDLEAILRKKALENLKKFRGKIKDNVETNVNEIEKVHFDANQLITAKDEVARRRLSEHGSSDETIKSEVKSEGYRSMKSGQDISNGGCSNKNSALPKQTTTGPPDTLAIYGKPIKDHASLRASDRKPETGNGKLSSKQAIADQTVKTSELSDEKLTLNKTRSMDTIDRTNHSKSTVVTDDHERRTKVVRAPDPLTTELASGVESTSENQSTNNQENEGKDGSGFEQKKMSVMRGGEMVEVSYKVYIPQRAPALARRQLKR